MRSLVVFLCLSGLALASLARAEDVPGKLAFEDGVAAAQAKRWQEARQHFETSLAQSDKPATRFNLVLVNDELHEPLEVVRHALPFLAFPDQAERAAARARARELLARATEQLAVLTTDDLVDSLELRVDGAAPSVRDQLRVYLAPGPHRLELRQGDELREAVEVELHAGQLTAWPRATAASGGPAGPSSDTPSGVPAASTAEPVADARPPAPPLQPTRTRIAWTLGSMGFATQLCALGTYLGAQKRADEFGRRDLSDMGVGEARDRYLRLRDAIVPLAFVGGALMAAAVAVGARSTRVGSLGWSISALIVATTIASVAMVLAFREPADVAGTNLPEPTRQAGGLLAASTLPLFAYGIGFLTVHRRDHTRRARAALPFGTFW